MTVVCEATQSPSAKLSVFALQSLVKIMSLYYQHMEQYMGQALFAVSLIQWLPWLPICTMVTMVTNVTSRSLKPCSIEKASCTVIARFLQLM